MKSAPGEGALHFLRAAPRQRRVVLWLLLPVRASGVGPHCPRAPRNLRFRHEAPAHLVITVCAQVIRGRWREISACFYAEVVLALASLAPDVVVVRDASTVLVAWSHVFQLGERRPAAEHNLHPQILERSLVLGEVPMLEAPQLRQEVGTNTNLLLSRFKAAVVVVVQRLQSQVERLLLGQEAFRAPSVTRVPRTSPLFRIDRSPLVHVAEVVHRVVVPRRADVADVCVAGVSFLTDIERGGDRLLPWTALDVPEALRSAPVAHGPFQLACRRRNTSGSGWR
jgi:hypothetical protein